MGPGLTMDYNISRCARHLWLAAFVLLLAHTPLTPSVEIEEPKMGRSNGCAADHFRCTDGKCIPQRWVCDHQQDCDDGIDEHQGCPPPKCGTDQFACSTYKFNSSYCLPKNYACDRIVDCMDGSDERDCDYRECLPEDHRCGTGPHVVCISGKEKCDGYIDCRDESDEDGCATNSTKCPLTLFRCDDGTKCIGRILLCDHHNDCLDGSDERNCTYPACAPGQFRCANHQCMPERWRCDGHNDCKDKSDELNCSQQTCPENKWLCPEEKKCIDRSKICDRVKDCQDEADEKQNCTSMLCQSLSCAQGCRASLHGGECFCLQGLKINPADNRSCIDLNECEEWGYCDQLCTNFHQGFNCSCKAGYELQDKVTCKAVDSLTMRLIFARQAVIYELNPIDKSLQELSMTAGQVGGLDFHYGRREIFWTMLENRTIHSLRLGDDEGDKKQERSPVLVPFAWNPVAIAVDWVSNKLYVADNLGQKIDVMQFDGLNHAIVLSRNLTNLQDIAVDPSAGYMFFSDGDHLERADLDGFNRRIIVTSLFRVNGLTLDRIKKLVIWCDSQLDEIVAVDYDGNRKHTILRGSTKVPSANKMTLFENKIYWTDATKQGILSTHLFRNNDTTEIMYQDRFIIKEPGVIKAYHKVMQPMVDNPCKFNKGGCQHMCIVVRGTGAGNYSLGYKCVCNTGYELTNDGRNCKKVDTFLLYSQQKSVRGTLMDLRSDAFSDAMIPIASKSARFVGIDFDAHEEFIYTSDVILDVIARVKPDGTSKENVLAAQHEGVEGIALDWVTKNLYFVDSRKGTLAVINTRDTQQRKVLMRDLRRPRAIVVHPNKGYIFYSVWDRPANISRAYLDGTNQQVVRGTSLGWPNGLAIDFENDRLYWCDALLDHIQHSNLDGSDVQTVNTTMLQLKHTFSITIFKEWMYVTDWRIEAIAKVHKTTGVTGKVLPLPEDGARLFCIKVYSKENQYIEPQHPCLTNNGGCEKFCFGVISASGGLQATCGCPTGQVLDDDQKKCKGDPKAEPSPKACPNSWDFTCDNQRCIPKNWVCDGDDDCLDGSDEHQNCKRNTCSAREFQCNSGRCVALSFKCDGDNDCGDGSDEQGCANATCNSNEFACENGRCVPQSWKCDSENDCGDGSDEGEFCTDKTCSTTQFACQSGTCIPKNWVCDGDADCVDKDDEKSCPPAVCTVSQFACENKRQCIHDSYRCDGIGDCSDNSDEKNCPSRSPNECDEKSFQCKSPRICIPLGWRCDGHKDCDDGSDEPDTCPRGVCPQNHFKCDNGRCIYKSWVCDGNNDCGDGSDEHERHACVQKPLICPYYQWACPNVTDRCINVTLVCDGKPDCPDGLDEGPGCLNGMCSPEKVGCTHNCTMTPAGPECTCPKGERLNDTTTCVDLDECTDIVGACSQHCFNNKGSYTCKCDEGYIQDPGDQHRCKAQDRSQAYLVISNRRSILVGSLDTSSLERVPVKVDNVVATASYMRNNTIFWFDMNAKKIFKLMKGGEPLTVISSGLDLIEGLSVDWVANNLYWVDSKLKTIEVSNLEGKNHIVLINNNISQPRGLSIDPRQGARIMFFSDWGENPRIESVGLDGSMRRTIIDTRIFWPNGLTLDLPNRRVYFADSKLDYIDFCNYDGTGRQQILAHNHYLLHPHSLTVFEDTLYWTDRQLNRVLSCDKFRGKNQTVVSHLVSQPLGIHVNHPILQPTSSNPCANAPCTHLCLLSPSASKAYACKCPPGYTLDRSSTNGVCIPVDKPFLMVLRGSQLVDMTLEAGKSNAGQMSPIIGLDRARDFDFDQQEDNVYIVKALDDDKENGTLSKINLRASNVTKFLPDGFVGAPYTVAVDWIGRNLYVGNRKASNIEIVSLGANSYRRVIISNDGNNTGVGKPQAIALDPIVGKLFWLDSGSIGVSTKIGYATMDGEVRGIVLDSNLRNIESLTIDPTTQRIYFSQSFPGIIESVSYTGTDRRTVFNNALRIDKPQSIGFYHQRIYFLDSAHEKVSFIDLQNGNTETVIEDNLSGLQSLKVYGKRAEVPDHPCLIRNGGCFHICVPFNGTARKCLCGVGFKLRGDTLCIPYNEFLVYSELEKASAVDIEGSNEAMPPIAGPGHNILHLDMLYEDKRIYWIEFNQGPRNGIFAIRQNGTDQQHIIKDGIGSNGIRGLAVDWVNRMLYFTNVFPHENFIEVSQLNGENRMVLLKTTTDSPRELAVDPIKRYLYWTDSGQYPKIERAFMDCTNRTSLVVTGIAAPRDLTVDIATNDIYWVDSKIDALQACAFDGSNRRTIVNGLPNPMGVAIYGDDVFWADRNLRTIFKINKNRKNDIPKKVKLDLNMLRDVMVYYDNNQYHSNSPCAGAGCAQLCFPLPTQINGKDFRCACASGQLDESGLGCSTVKTYLVFSTRKEIRSMFLDPQRTSLPFQPKGNLTNLVGMDFDYANHRMYFTKIRPDGAIFWMDPENPDQKVNVVLNKTVNPEGIAFDWTHKKIYFADSANRSIYAMNTDGTNIVMIANVERPRAIVLDPCDGYMYYTDWGRYGHTGKIFRATMAGNNKTAIVSSNLTQPSGLAIDYDDRKLYWTDALREKIERANLDGTDREELISATIYPFAITVHGPYIYWTDLQLRGVYRAEKHTGAGMQEIAKRLEESPRDIHVYAPERQKCNKTVCELNNGGCAQSCHPGPNGPECLCESNMKIANQGKMCVPENVTCDPSKFACANGKCIDRRYTCDSDDDCGDRSDENPKYCAVRTCSPTEFRCANERCLQLRWRCDHENDCGDNSDEVDCKYPECSGDEFTCANFKCIPNNQVCDGRDDCKDGNATDESHSHCPNNRTCPGQQVKCATTNICAEPFWLCDGDDDCGDNSDEISTLCSQRSCPANSFRCTNHRCIPANWHCDGDNDCGDGADEPAEYCKSEKRTCFGDLFTCDNGNCIPRTYLCDGDDDCLDRSDEDARHQCNSRECDPEKEFTCTKNKMWNRPTCIPKRWVCDGDPDCVDGADEDKSLNCPVPEPCSENQFRCQNSRCINKDWYCDHDNDCGDGSDEPKECKFRSCTSDEFTCRNSKCIRKNYVCDGEDDCGDRSDELKCANNSTCDEDTQYKCRTGDQCIPLTKVCDKTRDCRDGSDESMRCGINECATPESNGCEHMCVDTLLAYRCQCNPGYKLMPDGKLCTDIDECSEQLAVCSQSCVNTPGSFFCKCNDRYYGREPDGHKCKRLQTKPEPWVIFSNRYYLRNASIDGTQYNLVKMDLRNAVAIDFDVKEERIYYADVGNKTIHRMFVNGTGEEVVVKYDVHGLEGMAVDWVTRKLYWLDRTSKQLFVSHLNGTSRKVLLPRGISDPRAVVVHPGIGCLFFTDWGHHAFIARLGMDGSNFTRLVTYADKLVWPNALTVDYFSDKIFWADAHLDYIEYADFEGKNRHTVLSGQKVPHVFALSIFDDWLFWTDWNMKGIYRAHKFTGEGLQVLRNTSHRPYDIHVYHPLRQLPYSNPCEVNNGQCSHLCLLSPNPAGIKFPAEHRCACPEDFVLMPNNRTCIANCTISQHRCKGLDDEKCIPLYWKCDGEKDCSDGTDEDGCPPFKCKKGQFQCPSTTDTVCVSRIKVCDGQRDCPDGYDENNCKLPCGENSFKCEATGKCVPSSWQCDGDNDCSDGSDENTAICNHGQCDPETQFKCDNGKCIPKLWYCDFDNDCGDDSDEPAHRCRNQNCTVGWQKCPSPNNYRCVPSWLFCDGKDDCRDNSDETNPEACPQCHPTGDFKCGNGRCIPLRWRCDFEDDCGDGSDEEASLCEDLYRDCSESEFQCANKRCIPRKWRCDHDTDCDDGSDEQNCGDHKCRPDQFQCASGHCIAASLVCDGNKDCRDVSDERNCPPRYPNGRHCSPNQFQCNNTVCIKPDYVCDRDDDCGDSSDETEATCQQHECDVTRKFQCTNRACVMLWQLCDGKDDCGDGSDENSFQLCDRLRGPLVCAAGKFKCAGGRHCIENSKVCDHNLDCDDHSDELGCQVGECNKQTKGGCEHNCTSLSANSRHDYLCTCPSGYRINATNTKICEDIDECSTFDHYCSQLCHNLEGSYGCTCRKGFERVHMECHPKNGAPPVIMYTSERSIRLVIQSAESHKQIDLVADQGRIEGLDYDPVEKFVYWVDRSDKSVKRAIIPDLERDPEKLGAQYPQDLQLSGLNKPTAVAVDWVAHNLYLMDQESFENRAPKGRLMVATLDGRYRRTLHDLDIEAPTSVALDPESGVLFWTDIGINPKIETSWMDGSRRQTLFKSRLAAPASITIDYLAGDKRIYWADHKLNTIETAKPDGSNRVVVIKNDVAHPIGLEVFGDSFYWVNWKDKDRGDIFRMNKFGRGVRVLVRGGLEFASALRIYQDVKYNTSIENRCASAGCSHTCLLVPRGYRCSCPDGISNKNLNLQKCDAAFEQPKAAPYRCPCLNGGMCTSVSRDNAVCKCSEDFEGTHCENFVAKTRLIATNNNNIAAIMTPIIIVLILMVGGAALFVAFRKTQFKTANGYGGNPSVSFGGGGVDFSSHFMRSARNEPNGDPIDGGEFNLGDVKQPTDFANPMYDALGTVPGDGKPLVEDVSGIAISGSGTSGSAILTPSVITQMSSPQLKFKKKALNPTSKDTDKDTAMLVEEDASEA
ncbi:low-density lipoprotein receptor-related protein 2-like isoform X2 [Varroa jacobsoni]|uniref:low-density lipoprotein receptor-related protein 2-like isoform X2 n=1 Tax=Varroa jacobsoni TaxID=62625 RepID=UPI000BF68C3F|nr:low-density lipoprotein receptor-related protein 2-like isoform X2 [Varroa jacobsoni]